MTEIRVVQAVHYVRLTVLPAPAAEINPAPGPTIRLAVPASPQVVVSPVGLRGAPGQGSTISTDEGNTLAVGTDAGLFVPAAKFETTQW